MAEVLFWLLLPYDALVALPYFWLKVVFDIATGLLIPRKIVGLPVCVLVNAVLFIYSSRHAAQVPPNLMALPVWSIFAFAGVVWWVVGCILRWGILRIARIPGGLRFAAAIVTIAVGL